MKYKICAVAIATLSLSGCGWFYGKDGWIRDTEYDYLEAKEGKALQMPSHLKGFQAVDAFPVPALTEAMVKTAPSKTFNIEPPAMVLTAGEGVVGVQKADVPTALLYLDSEKLWERVLEYFNRNEIPVESTNKDSGQINTGWVKSEEIGWFKDWVMDQDIEAYRFKYAVQMSAGENPNENKLAISVAAAEALSEEEGWIAQPKSYRDGITMLNRFLGFYDEELTKDARARVLASRAGIDVKLWQDSENVAALFTQETPDRVWEITPQVIEKLGFLVDDKDTTKKIYFATLKHEGGGFFSWFTGGGDKKIDLKEGEYLFEVKPVGEGAAVYISSDGEYLEAKVLTEIYTTLQRVYSERRDNPPSRR